MKYMKKLLCISLTWSLLFLLCSCQQDTSFFYERSRKADGSGWKSNVINVFIEQAVYDIDGSATIQLTLGIGGSGKTRLDGTEHVWLTVEAPGCLINDRQDVYEKEYEEFYTDDRYRPDVKEHDWGYPDKIPNYHEQMEITFPEGSCKGEIVFTLYDEWTNATDVTTLEVYYAKNDSMLVFSDESEYRAEERLGE